MLGAKITAVKVWFGKVPPMSMKVSFPLRAV
jgi:hypothetical protein